MTKVILVLLAKRALSDVLEQGCPTFFLEGPFSDAGHRRRATSITHIMKNVNFSPCLQLK